MLNSLIEDEKKRETFINNLPKAGKEYFRWLERTQKIPQFSRRMAKRWIIKKAYELGWKKELFETFEKYSIHYSGRHSFRIERIGKKYQWIAFNIFLAYLSDNYHFLGSYHNNSEPLKKYKGAWEIYGARNIDPSFWGKLRIESDYESPWWLPLNFKTNKIPIINKDILLWLKDTSDIPDIKNLLFIESSNNKKQYFIAAANSNIRITTDKDDLKYYSKNKSISFSSFIINKTDLEEFKKWAYVELLTISDDRKLENRFLSEYYWHPDQKIDLNTNRFETKFLCKETSYNYQFKYSEYDYSYYDPDNSLKSSLLVPPVWMIDQFKLKMKNGYSPLWFDDTNELFFYDPSYYDPGVAAALINKKELEKYLSKSKYILVWYVFFQKNMIDEKMHNNLGEINYHGIYSTENGIITGNYKERDRYIISE